MKLKPWDLVGSRVFFYGVWEPVVTDFVRAHLQPRMVAVDIGANVGYYTLLFSRLVGPEGMVYSVEPSPSIRQDLEQNIALNQLNNVTVIPYGISNQDGIRNFYLNTERNLGASHFGEASPETSPRDRLEGALEVRRLREVVPAKALEQTALVKVDVEGMEYEVLQDLLNTLFLLPRLLVILAEVRMPTAEDPVCHLANEFRKAGFDTYVLENRYDSDYYAARITTPPQRVDQLAVGTKYDIAFVRQWGEVSDRREASVILQNERSRDRAASLIDPVHSH